MEIQKMIDEARARQNVMIAQIAEQKQGRQQEARVAFRARLIDMFGDLVGMLDMGVLSSEGYSDSAYAAFGYESRIYRLSMGRDAWYLTRRDTRLEDDDRELPSVDFSASYHNSMAANQDTFVLALAELSQLPETPMKPARHIDPTPDPRTCSEHEANLLDALRMFLQSEI